MNHVKYQLNESDGNGIACNEGEKYFSDDLRHVFFNLS